LFRPVLVFDGEYGEVGSVDRYPDVALSGEIAEPLTSLLLPGEGGDEGELESVVALLDEIVEERGVVFRFAAWKARDPEANLGRHFGEDKGGLAELVRLCVIATTLTCLARRAEEMGMSTTTLATKQMIPLLGMMWRGMWGATAATAAAQVIAADEDSDDEETAA
jgi:hypothetical protein